MPKAIHNGLEIHYEDTGTGPVVLLGHSFLCSGAMWRHQVAALASRYRVLNVDARGHGRSSPAREAFTVDDLVGDSLAVLRAAGVERATWCGLSLGGMVAMRAALRHPGRVERLVLMDTDAGREHPWRSLRNHAMGLGARVAGLRPFAGRIARLMFGHTTHREQPGLVEEWQERFARADVPSMWNCLRALMQRHSLLPELAGLQLPTLVLVGEEDSSLPPPCSRRIHRAIQGSGLVVVPRAGHLSALEQPDLVNAALVGFLSREGSWQGGGS